MATPILNQVSKDISYKLQDPVADGTADGLRYSALNRLGYITRAYRRFLRLVTMLYPDLVGKLFNGYYVITTATTDATGVLQTAGYSEVHEVFCKQPSDETYVRATYVLPTEFLSVKLGYNGFYKPDINNQNYYWTMLNNTVPLAPGVTLNLMFTYKKNIASVIEITGYNGSTDLDIPVEHTDLLTSLACGEAYMDLGQQDMLQMYNGDVNNQLQILIGVSTQQSKEGEDAEVS